MIRGRKLVAISAAAAAAVAGLTVAIVATAGDSADGGRGAGAPRSKVIPQPPLRGLTKLTRTRLAPASKRIDLVAPTFTNSTKITNPLFPIGNLQSAILLGRLEGKPWRAETTLLPYTNTVDWNGQRVHTLESQFVAYLNGRIFEVAVDHYAQADDGSVWYLGEDAFSYRHGFVSDTEGTWLAGVDGPPAMIMPAHPRVGDVYRTENIPGVVFEQVTIKRVGVTVNGPTGPVAGAIVGQEVHMDETRLEEKTFAPGYGEFHSGGGRTFEATALAIPVDSSTGPVPPDLTSLARGAQSLYDAARSKDWTAATATIDRLNSAWDALRLGKVPMPKRLGAQLSGALNATAEAVRARRPRIAATAALEVLGAGIDLELRYRPQAEIDLARFDLQARQLLADATGRAGAAVKGDVATMEWIRDRLALDSADARRIDDQLRYLEAGAEAGELDAVTHATVRLRELLAHLRPRA